MKRLLRFALMFILIFALVMLTESVILPALSGGETPAATAAQSTERPPDAPAVDEDGEYTEKDELALYIHLYGHFHRFFRISIFHTILYGLILCIIFQNSKFLHILQLN